MSKPKAKKSAPKAAVIVDAPAASAVEPVKPRLTRVASAKARVQPAAVIDPNVPHDPEDPDYLDEDDLKANALWMDPPESEPQPNPCRFKDFFDAPTSYARPLSLEITRRAIEDWRAAKKLSERAWRKLNAYDAWLKVSRFDPAEWDRRDADHDEFQVWANTANGILDDAASRLAGLIMVMRGLAGYVDEALKLPLGWNPVCLDIDNCVFVAAPMDPDGDPKPRLIVVGPGGFDAADFGSPTY